MLSRSDTELIGKTVEAYGKVVNTDELLEIFQSKYDKTSAHSRIQLLSKNGWLLRIKQGLYFVNDSMFGPIQENLPF
jgi:predicted transcriptional regulator of viral defense system